MTPIRPPTQLRDNLTILLMSLTNEKHNRGPVNVLNSFKYVLMASCVHSVATGRAVEGSQVLLRQRTEPLDYLRAWGAGGETAHHLRIDLTLNATG